MSEVLVVGSINADVVLRAERFPAPGATLVADGLERVCGGKGANQAVAAARAGAAARMVGAVGDDPDGATQVAALEAAGVDATAVERCAEAPTGTAFIVVVPSGENAIVVGAGANAHLDGDRVAAELVDDRTRVLLLSSEIGAGVVDAAAEAAARSGTRVVLNNGPWVRLAPRTLATADPLVLNEHEALEACPAAAGSDCAEVAHAVRATYGCVSVVLTHGAGGATISGEAGGWLPAAPVARVVDTTGAGDAFVGTMAAALARGDDLRQAVEHGQRAAALVVAVEGARLPSHVTRS
jgi:ribokinase